MNETQSSELLFYLAQLNIAKFKKPKEHPQNKGFVDNIDRVNAQAESHPGFIWRLEDESTDTSDHSLNDPNMITNLSVWESVESLGEFVYRNQQHRKIMRQREDWFSPIKSYLVLWWVPCGHIPTLAEAQEKLALLERIGPSAAAFTFKDKFSPPSDEKGLMESKAHQIC